MLLDLFYIFLHRGCIKAMSKHREAVFLL